MFNLFKKKERAFPCPCCGAPERFEDGDYAICRTCNWENDPVQLKSPDLSGGANKLSLNQARDAFKKTNVVNQITVDFSGVKDGEQALRRLGEIFEFGGPGGNIPVSSPDAGKGWGMNWNALYDSLSCLADGGIWGTGKKLVFPFKVVFENISELQGHDMKSFETMREIFEDITKGYSAEGKKFEVEFRGADISGLLGLDGTASVVANFLLAKIAEAKAKKLHGDTLESNYNTYVFSFEDDSMTVSGLMKEDTVFNFKLSDFIKELERLSVPSTSETHLKRP